MRTETGYLITEALPDWKHKATRVEYECRRQGIMLDPELARTAAEAEFAKWFSQLREEVKKWKAIGDAVEVPDFEQAVADLVATQIQQKAVDVIQTQPGLGATGGGLRKIEKVDSAIDF